MIYSKTRGGKRLWITCEYIYSLKQSHANILKGRKAILAANDRDALTFLCLCIKHEKSQAESSQELEGEKKTDYCFLYEMFFILVVSL